MPGRQFNGNDYRYGMNGQEKDDEIFQGAMTAEYWEYDSRLGRRWNRDPIVKPWESPYLCFNGNPVAIADINGDDGENPNGGCDISQKDANAGNSRVGDTYTDNTGKRFENKGGNEGWQPITSGSSDGGGNISSSGIGGGMGTAIMGRPLVAPALPWIIPAAAAALEEAFLWAAGTTVGVYIGDALSELEDDPEQEANKWLVYRIYYDEVTKSGTPVAFNRTYKYGISGQNFNTDGTHPRPKLQENALNALEATIANDASYTTIRVYRSEIVIQNVSKLAAEFMEQEGVNMHYATHGEAPEGNKRPLPDPLRGRTRKKFDKISPGDVFKFMKKIKN